MLTDMSGDRRGNRGHLHCECPPFGPFPHEI